MDNVDKKFNLLEKSIFKGTVFTLMIITTIIINLGYIQPRESSKVDYFKFSL